LTRCLYQVLGHIWATSARARKPTTRTIAGPKFTKPASSAEATQARLAENYGKLPLSFEANQGQTDPQVKFLSRGSGYTLFLTRDEAVLSLRSRKPDAALGEAKGAGSQKDKSRQRSVVSRQLQKPTDHGQRTTDVLRMKLVGANRAANVTALDELPGKSNYFVGNDPKKWRTDVPTYGKVKYAGVYPGVDLVYYGNQRQLEYDFVVAPGADPKAITLAIENRNSKIAARQSKIQRPVLSAAKDRKSKIDASGDLVVEAEGGEVRFHKPVVYQPAADAANPKSKIQNRKLLDGRYILTADNRVQFEIAGYDTTKPLVIDPVLVYSTYLGGNDDDHGDAIAVDSSGNAYVAGYTVSGNFPWTNSFGGPGVRVWVQRLGVRYEDQCLWKLVCLLRHNERQQRHWHRRRLRGQRLPSGIGIPYDSGSFPDYVLRQLLHRLRGQIERRW